VKAKIHITLKNGILDPQGKTIQHGLEMLGFTGLREVRTGKLIEIFLPA
jgi:phosphoribosylformylglycinamidine synthase